MLLHCRTHHNISLSFYVSLWQCTVYAIALCSGLGLANLLHSLCHSIFLLASQCMQRQAINQHSVLNVSKHLTSNSSDAALHQEVNHLLASVDELSAKQLGDALTAYDVKSPDTRNDISAPFPFNLMFKTSIGPKGDQVGYLRPETAQGLFVNFRYNAVAFVMPQFLLCFARQHISIFSILLLKSTIFVS